MNENMLASRSGDFNKKTDKKLGMRTNHSGTGTGEHSGTVKGGGRKI